MRIQNIKEWLRKQPKEPMGPQFEIVEQYSEGEGASGPKTIRRLMDDKTFERFENYIVAIQGTGEGFFDVDIQNFHEDLIHVTIRIYDHRIYKSNRKVEVDDLYFMPK